MSPERSKNLSMNTDDHDASFLPQFDPPYSFLRSIFPMKSIQREEAEEFKRLLSSSRYVEQDRASQRSGIILWNTSEFDSKILDRTCAKVHRILTRDPSVARNLVKKLVSDLRSASISYTSVRIPSDYSLAQILEDEGFRIVDGIIYLYSDLRSFSAKPHSVRVRPVRPGDHDRLLAISESAFVYGRFYHDPAVTKEQANTLYKTWVENSLKNGGADTIFVAEHEGEPAAFVTLKILLSPHIAVGSIDLLAVGGEARGKGIASALLTTAAAYFQDKHINAMIVDTQIHNHPGLGLYTKFGFKFGKTYITLRLQL